ncbi:ceramide synthase 4a isoform X1 [Takifugu rubripes]|uniref:Ceramide synthase 4a n=2 Tax=Takifugu rubripes TaxID=31033 RepID=H2U6H2_TAKRU|nr:ceramide synthase 2 isoform X1 [Takifugu rubripes]XP_011613174.1 ceramide synthase 2 isoform X1 [Takifugu rubripes]|eukprot:XP_003974254.2 PREDICTED: ceramide synthase 4 isoform X1 [Takifugu rubripes]
MNKAMEALLNEWLWQEEFWLPPGTRWQDFHVKDHVPLPRDLLYTLPLAFAFIALRYVFERVVSAPLSKGLGVKDKVRIRAPFIPKLENFYELKSRQPSQSEVVSLGQQCGLSQRKVQTWFRRRRNQDRPSNTKKFCEASWRFAFYLVAFSAGLASLIYTPWFWDHTEFWRGYPKQAVDPAHHWYYILEMGFYVSLLLSVSVDVKRKDFKEQVIHHIATIFLIGFSYCANFVRVGTFVMLVHDSSDFLLESAKMFHYAGWRRTCDSLFVVFAAVFLVTRLLVLPVSVLYGTLVVSREFFRPFSGYYVFNALLLVLQALHIFWAYLILRMVYKFVFMGKVERDERSDEESEAEDEPDEEGEECRREHRKGGINSKLTSLANNCMLNNLTNQRNINSRLPKAR